VDSNKEKFSKNIIIVICVAVLLAGLIIYFTLDILNIKWPSKNKNASLPAIEVYQPLKINEPAPEKKNLVKDVVCSNLVDADKTNFYSKFLDYTFYFDTQECLRKFEADPLKYLPGKIKVKIKLKEEPKETIVSEPEVIVKSQPRKKIEVEELDAPANVGDYPPGTVNVEKDQE